MTNIERIQSMTRTELTIFLFNIADCCYQCAACDECPLNSTSKLCDERSIYDWLSQEVSKTTK